ncbi:hypothetical protein T484DRAFT_1984946 [Baffinella frigidus]|nr:hypothetical protein T484DRAFT_1984946 [Cryptophyta sp. CCMP2293]
MQQVSTMKPPRNVLYARYGRISHVPIQPSPRQNLRRALLRPFPVPSPENSE